MRSPNSPFAWLLFKEWRELLASRAWWCFLLLMGPLTGVGFINAVTTYAEASGLHGTAGGVGEAFSPLVGIWAPTFSACELAAAFLLPFVAIRIVGGDKQTGALLLEVQGASATNRISAKAVILFVAWAVASLAPLLTVVLWASYGGHVYFPELGVVIAGHFLNAALTIALAAAAAAICEHPSTAAIVTLAVTVGSWIVSFLASIHGGFWEILAGFTPTSMVAQFQHGLLRLDLLLVALLLVATGLWLAAVWSRPGVSVRSRALQAAALAVVSALVVFAAAQSRASWDFSENRMNSFSRAEESALRGIAQPLHITVHLAAQDPRRMDFERRVLPKLRRAVPQVTVDYVAATSTGLFEQSDPRYGELDYSLNGKSAVSRAVTAEGVLETIFTLAATAPTEAEDTYRGYPLAAPPRFASFLYYVLWPLLVLALALIYFRRNL